MKFITYYTPKYSACATMLTADAEAFGLDLIAEPLPAFKDWQQATRFKATFIGAYLNKLNEDVCFIDADARIRKDPVLIKELSSADCDIAAVYFKDIELLSGTLWMANTPIVKEIITDWIALNIDPKRSRSVEQQNLQVILDKYPECRFRRLPPEYAAIFDLSRMFYKDIEIVIEHFQRSRQIRREENGNRSK